MPLRGGKIGGPCPECEKYIVEHYPEGKVPQPRTGPWPLLASLYSRGGEAVPGALRIETSRFGTPRVSCTARPDEHSRALEPTDLV